MPMGHVIVHVDETWNGAPVSDADRNALAPFVQDAEPEITTVRVIPRARPQADAARALAKAQRARPGRRPAPPSSPSSAERGGQIHRGRQLGPCAGRAGHPTAIPHCDVYGFSVPDLLAINDPLTTRDGRWVPIHVAGVDMTSMKVFIGDNAVERAHLLGVGSASGDG